MGHERKKRRTFTEKEINLVEGWAMVRLPVEDIATLLNTNVTDFLEARKKHPALQRAFVEGKSKSTLKARTRLYELATGRGAVHDDDGKKITDAIPPDFPALKFWCETQEGFKRADKLEISGPEGRPIETKTVTRAELEAEVAALRRANDLTADE